jgi:hypothetical protein
MNRFFGPRLVLTVAACAGLLVAQPVDAQREQRERSILVGAVGAKDAPVADLTIKDFSVRENGATREVVRVQTAPPPTHIVLLIDDSAATQLALPFVRDSLPKFVARMADMSPAPQIGLWSFGERPTKRVDVAPNPSAVLDGIKKLFAIQGAGGYLLQGIIEVTDDLRKKKVGTEGFSSPIIVTFVAEGGVEYSSHQRSQVVTALKNTGASLWSVTLQQGTQPMNTTESRERAAVLGDVTADSGGMNKVILTPQAIDGAFSTVASIISSRYLVTYVRPDALVPPDKLDVTTSRKDVKLFSSKWTR